MRIKLNEWLLQDESRTLEDALAFPAIYTLKTGIGADIFNIEKINDKDRVDEHYTLRLFDGFIEPLVHNTWIEIEVPDPSPQYSVVHVDTVERLVEIVSDMIRSENGWKIVGSVVFDGQKYLQTLIK